MTCVKEFQTPPLLAESPPVFGTYLCLSIRKPISVFKKDSNEKINSSCFSYWGIPKIVYVPADTAMITVVQFLLSFMVQRLAL